MNIFIPPLFKEYDYLEQEYNGGVSICYASMMGNGIILEDKNGKIKELQSIAKEYIKKPFMKVDEYKIKTDLYHVWDQYDELKSMHSQDLNINMMYYQLLKALIELYYYYNGYAIIPISKLEQIYKNENYRNNYCLKNMPNNDFITLVIMCIDEKNDDDKIKQIDKLYKYVVNSCGGFNIEQFKIGNEIKK